MKELERKVVHLVTQGDTRWYLHYGLMLSLFRFRKGLEAYKSTILDSYSILSEIIVVSILDSIGSPYFWTDLGLLWDIIRPINIEIDVIERYGENLSQMAQYVGRLYEYLSHKCRSECARYACMSELLNDLLMRWEWRVSLYAYKDLLNVVHIIDPSIRLDGLLTSIVTPQLFFKSTEVFAIRYSPKLM